MKIWTDDEYIEVDPNDVGQLEAAMLFKAEHIKAKADPELFAAVAEMLSRLWDYATNRVDVVRCRECTKHYLFTCPMCFIENKTLQFINLSPDFYCGEGEREEGSD